MRKRQNTLLAGVAALALVAGVGVASAQQSPQGKTGSPGMSEQSTTHDQTAKPNAGTGMEQHAQTAPATGAKVDTTGGAAALNTKSANQPPMAQKGSESAKGQKSAQEINGNKMGSRANKTAESRPEHLGANAKVEHNRSTARNERERRGHMSTAQRNERGRMNTARRNEHNLKGLQGNASVSMQGRHATLTQEQRTRIRETVVELAERAAGRPCRLRHPRWNAGAAAGDSRHPGAADPGGDRPRMARLFLFRGARRGHHCQSAGYENRRGSARLALGNPATARGRPTPPSPFRGAFPR